MLKMWCRVRRKRLFVRKRRNPGRQYSILLFLFSFILQSFLILLLSFKVSESLLSIYLDEYDETPWDALKYLVRNHIKSFDLCLYIYT